MRPEFTEFVSKLKLDIDAASKEILKESPRKHLGASKIGSECERSLWLSFRWMHFPEHSGQQLRLFSRGQKEENNIRNILIKIGWEFYANPDGSQFKFSKCLDHFGGSCDDIAKVNGFDIPLLVEYKTHKGGSEFNTICRNNLRLANPNHFAQMCCYGEAFGLTHGAYFCVNKSNDEIDVKFSELDYEIASKMEDRASKIIFSEEELPRPSWAKPTYFKCKLCDYYKVCYKTIKCEVNCRSCVKSAPIQDGQWCCKLHNCVIPEASIANSWPCWESF